MTRALVVAAPSSGSGKTTVATGLMAAFTRRGTPVAPFKVGPDYIDPGYHALATGRPGRNLDPVLVGDSRIGPLVRHGSAGCELAIVEGVMGLFDGRVSDGAGSTAQVARLVGAPVVLVVDCKGQSRSLAALLHGFRSFDPDTRLAGVVLNRVGSPRHEEVLRAACDEVGLPVLGALPRRAELAVPSRHLGLITAAEHGAAALAAVDAMATLVAAHVDLDAVLRVAGPLPSGPAWDAAGAVAPARPGGAPAEQAAVITGAPGPVRIGMLGGPAFSFGYAEHPELLAAAGAEVVIVDPLRDEALPDGTAALVLPGGFPEEHVAALGANERLLRVVRELAAGGAPIRAECGGLLYLCRELDGIPLVGALDATASTTGRLTLGYRDAVALTGSSGFAAGERVSGHEFHHCAVTPRAGTSSRAGDPARAGAAWAWRGGDPEGFVAGGVHASFLHTHPAGGPAGIARFVAAARSGALSGAARSGALSGAARSGALSEAARAAGDGPRPGGDRC